jgi:hypothetical protein
MVITEFYRIATQQATATMLAGGSQDNGTELTFEIVPGTTRVVATAQTSRLMGETATRFMETATALYIC